MAARCRVKLKLTKCELLQDEVHYLGHVVSVKGVATDLAKVKAIKNGSPPPSRM